METLTYQNAKFFTKDETSNEFSLVYPIPEDTTQMSELLKFVWNQTFKDFLSDAPAHILFSKQKIKKWVDDPLVYVRLVKFSESHIVGVINAIQEEGGVHISNLYVHPGFQHKGLGSKLINSVYSNFLNHKRFTIRVFEKNIHARNFYRIKSFCEVSVRNANFGTEKTPSILMERLVD